MDGRDWCSRQISQLNIEELKISSLNEIKNYFYNAPVEEAAQTAHSLELSLVFDCLNATNSEEVDLACEVLSLCMQNLSLGETTNRYSSPLEKALNHPSSSVKMMALKEIERNLEKEDVLVQFSRQHHMLISVIRCMSDEESSVFKHAGAVIIKVGQSSEAVKNLLSSDCLAIIKDMMSSREVVRLRFDEVFVNISKQSEKLMKTFVSAGLMQSLVEDLYSNDILLKLNIVEILSQLVTTKHGYQYLDSEGIIDGILTYFDKNEDPLSAQLCEAGILKFFGHMAHWEPLNIITKYPNMLNRLCDNIVSDEIGDLGLVLVSLDTLGYIAETNEGKLTVDSLSQQYPLALREVFSKLTAYPSDVRLRALACLESAIRISELESQVTNIVRKWYNQLDSSGGSPMNTFYKYAQNPFVDIRMAGLNLLIALATHNWGHEIFRNTPGFTEYLLDRRGETFKECKEAKYQLVNMLSQSEVFEENSVARFKKFVKEGPFYVESVMEVAIEGED